MNGRICLAVTAALLAGDAFAQSANSILEREWWQTTDLREHIGQTYLQTFLADIVGIHAELVADYNRPIVIADADTVVATLNKFNPEVSKKIFEDYFDGQEGFVSVVEQIAGRTIPTVDLRDALKARVDATVQAKWASQELSEVADMVLLASGAGTFVRLDDRNYFYNVAFQTPTDIRDAVTGYLTVTRWTRAMRSIKTRWTPISARVTPTRPRSTR